jgi:hypothetical protein
VASNPDTLTDLEWAGRALYLQRLAADRTQIVAADGCRSMALQT